MKLTRPLVVVCGCLTLSACLVVPRHSRLIIPVPPPPAIVIAPRAAPPPPPPPAPPPPPPSPPPEPAYISQDQAIDIATEYARSQGLRVWRVREARLDAKGRYHVYVTGDHGRDRARVLIDGISGHVIRALLRDAEGSWD